MRTATDLYMDRLQDSWSSNWHALGCKQDTRLMDQLMAAYAEPQRKYHTQQHLAECLTLFEQYAHLAARPHEVAIALWFHDAVYDLRAADNEAESAAWAQAALAAAVVNQDAILRVRDLIMATCHDAVPDDRDQQLLVDIDLAILGAEEGRFAEYEAQVREEYAWVPEPQFRQVRAGLLAQLLARPSIYNTLAFQERFEAQARQNLSDSVEALLGKE